MWQRQGFSKAELELMLWSCETREGLQITGMEVNACESVRLLVSNRAWPYGI